MSKIDDGGPAFAQTYPRRGVVADDGTITPILDGGMSLRDWFAGQAMNGLTHSLSNPEHAAMIIEHAIERGESPSISFAKIAYDYADAMIAARKGEAS